MGKQKPIPSAAEITLAITRATEGQGRQLAKIVKSFSIDDLARAFSRVNQCDRFAYHALGRALAFAAGMREQRAIQTEERRQWRKEWRAEQGDKA